MKSLPQTNMLYDQPYLNLVMLCAALILMIYKAMNEKSAYLLLGWVISLRLRWHRFIVVLSVRHAWLVASWFIMSLVVGATLSMDSASSAGIIPAIQTIRRYGLCHDFWQDTCTWSCAKNSIQNVEVDAVCSSLSSLTVGVFCLLVVALEIF